MNNDQKRLFHDVYVAAVGAGMTQQQCREYANAAIAALESAEVVSDMEKNAHELPWREAPKWAEWAAMDEDGEWYWYDGKPLVGSVAYLWFLPGSGDRELKFTAPPFPGDWKDSLQRRPHK